jgi:hypothetical protein
MKECYSALRKKARATKQKMAIVKKKLISHLDKITLDDSDKSMKDILNKAMLYIQKNESSCQKAILQALMDIEQKRAGVSTDVNNDSTNEEMAELICNHMRNSAHVIARIEHQIRYSAQSIQIPMVLWLGLQLHIFNLRNCL